MNKVQTFDDLYRVSNEWQPVLTCVSTLEEAADCINFPHEDYPEFVDSTLTTLKEVLVWLENSDIVERDIKQIHQMCMEGKEYIKLGDYRTCNVVVSGNLVPPQPYLIPQMMMSICPVGKSIQKNDVSIIDWYKQFETIHPFEDGNGRTGGIIMAAISYINGGKYLVSKKEYHFFIDLIFDRIDDIEDPLLNNSKYFDQSLDFDTRSVQYIIGKMKNKTFLKILDETNNLKKLSTLTEDNNILEIRKLLNKIKK